MSKKNEEIEKILREEYLPKSTVCKGKPKELRRYYRKQYYSHIVWNLYNPQDQKIKKDGYIIHHIDGNPINNELSNLQCLLESDHLNNHGAAMSEAKRQHLRDNMEAVRVFASRWHGSPEGREWHKIMGKMAWEGREPQTFICEQCGREYQTISLSGNTRFCSNNCKSAGRRASGVDNEQRTCAKCGQSFPCNKYSVQRFCSRLCGQRERRSK